MRLVYKCCMCKSLYDWYDCISDRKGITQPVNCVTLDNFAAIGDCYGNQITHNENEPLDNLDGKIFNLCPDCMKKLIDELYPIDE